jgi:diketogulonate reductase-like aldo/keto reductase
MANEHAITEGQRVRLADGNAIPALGLGVWQVPDGPECVNAVRWALEAGYRHIDTAQAYGNEGSVGQALRESGVPRDEVFITTKFFPRHRDPVAEAEKSLRRLDVDQVDLYIIHWPQGGPTWAWPGMEAARERDVALEAYSPLGTGRHLSDATVGAIAQRLGRTSAQVLLRWCIQRGTIVLPKSTHQDRIVGNAQVFDFALTDDDMAALDALDHTGGTGRARESKWW